MYGYHRLTRANTPASVSFRRFLPFSPWRAPARLRLKSQKSLEDPSLAGAGSFAGAEMCPDKERPAENTAVLSRGLTRYGRISARQNRVCPCQSMVYFGVRIGRQALTGRGGPAPLTAALDAVVANGVGATAYSDARCRRCLQWRQRQRGKARSTAPAATVRWRR